MRLTIDTNELFSFFNEKSKVRELSLLPELELRELSLLPELELYAPSYAL